MSGAKRPVIAFIVLVLLVGGDCAVSAWSRFHAPDHTFDPTIALIADDARKNHEQFDAQMKAANAPGGNPAVAIKLADRLEDQLQLSQLKMAYDYQAAIAAKSDLANKILTVVVEVNFLGIMLLTRIAGPRKTSQAEAKETSEKSESAA